MVCRAKLGWRLKCEEYSLWAQVLLRKYGTPGTGSRKRCSNAWKGIEAANHIVKTGLSRIVRNGNTTRFWMDTWIGDKPLFEVMQNPVSLPELYAAVSEYWVEGRGWNWNMLHNLIPVEVTNKLASFVLSPVSEEEDTFGWKYDTSGVFSIRLAYELITKTESSTEQPDWQLIWHLSVPMRICMFIWLLTHGRVMTNVERARRGLTSNIACLFCAGYQEDCNHLFRFCKEAQSVWETQLDRGIVAKLNGLSWKDWLSANLHGDRRFGLSKTWPARFAICAWWIWKWRNEGVFNDRRIALEHKITWISQQVQTIDKAFTTSQVAGMRSGILVECEVQWQKPPYGWIKVNVDGSCNPTNGTTSCGGIIRDHHGKWLGGYMYNIGSCSSEEAEAWGILQGLYAASRVGGTNIIIESDSSRMVEVFEGGCTGRGCSLNICRRGLHFAKGFVSIKFGHVLREQNRAADYLAKQALLLPMGLATLNDVPTGLGEFICEDQMGARFCRQQRPSAGRQGTRS